MNQPIDISNKTLQELKAIAYDLIATKEQSMRDLEVVNGLIQKKSQEAIEIE